MTKIMLHKATVERVNRNQSQYSASQAVCPAGWGGDGGIFLEEGAFF